MGICRSLVEFRSSQSQLLQANKGLTCRYRAPEVKSLISNIEGRKRLRLQQMADNNERPPPGGSVAGERHLPRGLPLFTKFRTLRTESPPLFRTLGIWELKHGQGARSKPTFVAFPRKTGDGSPLA